MQMLRLESAAPFGSGVITDYNCVADTGLMQQMVRYRRAVAGSYQAVTRDEIAGKFTNGRFAVSPKIDGEIWFLMCHENDACLVNPRGQVIHGGIPILDEARRFASRCVGLTILAGELFAATKDGRPRVGDVAVLFGGGASAKVDALGFAPFDLVCGGDGQAAMPLNSYDDRLAVIQRLCDGGKRVTPVKTEIVHSADHITNLFSTWVTDGKAEGLVVRAGNERIFKVKEAITIDAAIIGYTVRTEDASQVRSFLFGLMREDGQYQVLGATGNLGNDDQRKQLMGLVSGSEVASNYRHVSNSGELYRFVLPRHVAEIKVTDLQSVDSSGLPAQRMVLRFGDDRWESVRQMPGISLIHPVFVRLRPDKQINAVDIRISQVTDRCYIPEARASVSAKELPQSELVRREVYTKKAKDQIAVRKLLVWKTNKEQIDSAYPAYVVHFTDYSAGRKEPLSREVRLAPSEAAAMQIAAAMLEENIKKGWEPVAANPAGSVPPAEPEATKPAKPSAKGKKKEVAEPPAEQKVAESSLEPSGESSVETEPKKKSPRKKKGDG